MGGKSKNQKNNLYKQTDIMYSNSEKLATQYRIEIKGLRVSEAETAVAGPGERRKWDCL